MLLKSKNRATTLARIGVIGALYFIAVMIFFPISYGGVQVRIAEALTILPLLMGESVIGLAVGCMLANFFGNGILDVVFGTLATFLACITMSKIKNRYISSLMPVLFNAVIIGLELYFYLDLPLIYSMLGVAVGEIVVVTIIGNLLCYFIEKNNQLMELITTK